MNSYCIQWARLAWLLLGMIIGVLGLGYSSLGGAADVVAPDYRIWAEDDRILRACQKQLPEEGVACIVVNHDRAQSIRALLGGGAKEGDSQDIVREIMNGTKFNIHRSRQELDPLESLYEPEFRAGLVIDGNNSEGLPPAAFIVVIKAKPPLSSWSVTDDRTFVWERIKAVLPVAPSGSVEETAYLKQREIKSEDAKFAAERATQRDQIRLAENARRAREQSPQYQIARCHKQIGWARQEMEREKRIAQVSGYENKRKLYDLGNLIITCEDTIRTQWPLYKASGGTAKNPSELAATVPM